MEDFADKVAPGQPFNVPEQLSMFTNITPKGTGPAPRHHGVQDSTEKCQQLNGKLWPDVYKEASAARDDHGSLQELTSSRCVLI